MPSRNIVKMFVENGYYHVYSRGVDRREIFLDEQDCEVFLYYIKLYLSPIKEIQTLFEQNKKMLRFLSKNLSMQVELLAFSLMPNHFHLLVKQHTNNGVTQLMKRLVTAYVMYFNNKYERRGPLFESVYKACLIDQDSYLVHLSRYIHLNPIDVSEKIVDFNRFSSYSYYLGLQNSSWVKPQGILEYFNKTIDTYHVYSYKSFVEDYKQKSEKILGSLTLENDKG